MEINPPPTKNVAFRTSLILCEIDSSAWKLPFLLLVEHRKRVVDSHRSKLIAPFPRADFLFPVVIAEVQLWTWLYRIYQGAFKIKATEIQVSQFMNIYFFKQR